MPHLDQSIDSFLKEALLPARDCARVLSSTGTGLLRKVRIFRYDNSGMTQAQIGITGIQLADKYAALARLLRNRVPITTETIPDTFDLVQLMREREVTIRNLRQIGHAQTRIADGSYGLCLHCQEEIAVKRLNVAPWVVLCLKCQDQAGRHRIEVESAAGDALPDDQ
jgi:DnaK suppressor protein